MNREIAEILREYQRRRGEPLALATVVSTQGSSYRRPGARMLITQDRGIIGTVSGGCLEEEVAERAMDVLMNGIPARMSFDMRARFGCEGIIEIVVERVNETFLEALATAKHERRSCLIATSLPEGSVVLNLDDACPAAAFCQRIDPAIRLLIVGHSPDTIPLQAFAAILGWECVFVESATQLSAFMDPWTAAIIATHNYGRDFAALRALCMATLPYVGLVGSRRRREQLLADLLDTGVESGPELFSPAGLDLGAESPEQIALCIAAEIQSVFSASEVQSLRGKTSAIHALPPSDVTSTSFAVS